jgi:hypothetical protein
VSLLSVVGAGTPKLASRYRSGGGLLHERHDGPPSTAALAKATRTRLGAVFRCDIRLVVSYRRAFLRHLASPGAIVGIRRHHPVNSVEGQRFRFLGENADSQASHGEPTRRSLVARRVEGVAILEQGGSWRLDCGGTSILQRGSSCAGPKAPGLRCAGGLVSTLLVRFGWDLTEWRQSFVPANPARGETAKHLSCFGEWMATTKDGLASRKCGNQQGWAPGIALEIDLTRPP